MQAIGKAMVNFAAAVGRAAGALLQAANQGVYVFFRKLYGSDASTYTPFNYWRGFISSNDEFFIRVANLPVDSNSYGIGVFGDVLTDGQSYYH